MNSWLISGLIALLILVAFDKFIDWDIQRTNKKDKKEDEK